MKTLLLSFFAIAMIASVSANAVWGHPGPGPGPGPGGWNGPGNGPGPGPGGWNGPGNGPGPGPGWDGPGPDHRVCQVIYKVCMFGISGFCVKWNNKSFQMECRDAWHHGCWEAERREGQRIENCRIQ